MPGHFWEALGCDSMFPQVVNDTGAFLFDRADRFGCLKYIRNHHVLSSLKHGDKEMGGNVYSEDENGEEEYLYDDKALEKYRKRQTGPFTLQRYKGLGEMDAEQLWETTLNPETRIMKRVEIEDARMASAVTEMLMGSEVPPRRAFIYENAEEAELDV